MANADSLRLDEIVDEMFANKEDIPTPPQTPSQEIFYPTDSECFRLARCLLYDTYDGSESLLNISYELPVVGNEGLGYEWPDDDFSSVHTQLHAIEGHYLPSQCGGLVVIIRPEKKREDECRGELINHQVTGPLPFNPRGASLPPRLSIPDERGIVYIVIQGKDVIETKGLHDMVVRGVGCVQSSCTSDVDVAYTSSYYHSQTVAFIAVHFLADHDLKGGCALDDDCGTDGLPDWSLTDIKTQGIMIASHGDEEVYSITGGPCIRVPVYFNDKRESAYLRGHGRYEGLERIEVKNPSAVLEQYFATHILEDSPVIITSNTGAPCYRTHEVMAWVLEHQHFFEHLGWKVLHPGLHASNPNEDFHDIDGIAILPIDKLVNKRSRWTD
jgi:hypothetical protein